MKTLGDFRGKVLSVDLGDRSYPIYVGSSALAQLGSALACHSRSRRAIIITDENVAPHYAQAACDSLAAAGLECQVLAVAPGEQSKSAATAEDLYESLFEHAVERSDTIVALGGGIVGDLAGFIAATFKRGVNYVQAPTSLLAMVDSSIGGKTAINHARGKNMIGVFYQPKMVLADIATLATLPQRELGCGLAETVKHAIIRDGDFFGHLEQHCEDILALDREVMIALVVRNCRIKSDVVSADERESGLRGILNFGHTIGHTFETVLPGHPYHHGEAVSLGMVAELRLALGREMISIQEIERIIRLLESFGLPTNTEHDLPIDDLCVAMKQDKKVKAGKIIFALPTAIGECTFVNDIGEAEIKGAMASLQDHG